MSTAQYGKWPVWGTVLGLAAMAICSALVLFTGAAPAADTGGQPVSQSEESVTFSPVPAKTGYKVNNDGTFKESLWGHETATVNPPAKRDSTTFGLTGATAEVVLDHFSKSGLDQWKFDVGGKQMTPADKPDGDVTIQGKIGGKVKGQVNAIVIVPKTDEHVVPDNITPINTATVLLNLAGDPVALALNTKATVIVNIKVRDQFGQMLDPIYDGTAL